MSYTLPLELVSGIKRIDELTLEINNPATPAHLVPFLTELRDKRIMQGDCCSSYEMEMDRLIFKKENRAAMPTFRIDKTKMLDEKHQLVLEYWSHITFNNKEFPLCYVKDITTGKKYFRSESWYGASYIIDKETGEWLNPEDGLMCLNGLTTKLVWHLFQMSEYVQCKPLGFYHEVAEKWSVADGYRQMGVGKGLFFSRSGYYDLKELEHLKDINQLPA